MSKVVPVAVIGAGPYGLSAGAYLRNAGVEFRIFGIPMESWRFNMPEGMLLKSEGFASSLYDPAGDLTLKRYCNQRQVSYADLGLPVSREMMCDYGDAFQARILPHLEGRRVVSVDCVGERFSLRLDTNEIAEARRVVVATGTPQFRYVPEFLRGLPQDLSSHSSDHCELQKFANRQVAVIGGGSSAMDLAVLLRESGADVTLITRRMKLRVLDPPETEERSLWQRVRWPITGLGHGWKLVGCIEAPMLFRALPASKRVNIVQTFLGPAAGWSLREQLAQCPTLFGHQVAAAQAIPGGRIQLQLRAPDGRDRLWEGDHVIAATGFQPDTNRIAVLSADLRAKIRQIGKAPLLSFNFESSVPGLYFTGLASAYSFGPVMRFMLGARYTASCITRHVLRKEARRTPAEYGIQHAATQSASHGIHSEPIRQGEERIAERLPGGP